MQEFVQINAFIMPLSLLVIIHGEPSLGQKGACGSWILVAARVI